MATLMNNAKPIGPDGLEGVTLAEARRAVEAAEAAAAAGNRPAAILELERASGLEPDSVFILRALGGLLLDEERNLEALQRFRRLVHARPQDPEARVLCAVSALRLGRLDEFHDEIARALGIRSDHADALRWRGRVAFDNHDHAAAGRDYARLVELGHGDADTLTTLGFCLARGGHWLLAAETFARTVIIHGTAEVARENLEVARRKLGRAALPTTGDALSREASEDHAHGNQALACWAWLEMLRINPRDHATRRGLVSVMLDHKWLSPALPHLEELVRFSPWDPALGTWLALIRFEAGHHAKAWEALKAVFTLDPRHLEARRLEVDMTLREGRHEEAFWLSRRLVQDHPEDVVARITKGICAFHRQRWDESVEDLEWVLTLQPDNALVRSNLEVARERSREARIERDASQLRTTIDEAGRLQAAGDLNAAIALLVPVTEQRPDWAEAWDALGALRFMIGDTEGARRDLSEANRLSPGLPDLQVRLAMACNATGRPSEAVALLSQVSQEQPGHVASHRMLGDLLLESEPASAVASYAACLKANATVADDLVRLGVALVQQGRIAQGVAVFEAILAFDPTHEAATKARHRFGPQAHE